MGGLMEIRRRMLNTTELPPEYLRKEYIRTSGHNAKFNSGVAGNDTTLKIEFDWMLADNGTTPYGAYYGMFGNAQSSGSTQYWRMMRYTQAADPNATYWLTYAGTGANATVIPYGTGITCVGKKMHCVFTYGRCEIGDKVGTSTGSGTMSTEPIWFGTTSPTSSGIKLHEGRFYSIRIWSGGKLIRDYVPCLRRADNVAGFYDKVHRTFNPSTGSAEFEAA